MQASLHQHARAAQLDRLTNLFVDRVEIENLSLFGLRSFQRTIKSAERAIFCAEIRVINVAIDDVSGDAFGMKAAANGIGFHPDSDQIIGAVEVKSLGLGERHVRK